RGNSSSAMRRHVSGNADRRCGDVTGAVLGQIVIVDNPAVRRIDAGIAIGGDSARGTARYVKAIAQPVRSHDCSGSGSHRRGVHTKNSHKKSGLLRGDIYLNGLISLEGRVDHIYVDLRPVVGETIQRRVLLGRAIPEARAEFGGAGDSGAVR